MSERHRLRDTRPGILHRWRCGTAHGHVGVGCFEDGRPGELFLYVDPASADESIVGWADQWAWAVSIALQYGATVEDIFTKGRNQRFGVSGPTGNPAHPFASSIVDVVSAWMLSRFGRKE